MYIISPVFCLTCLVAGRKAQLKPVGRATGRDPQLGRRGASFGSIWTPCRKVSFYLLVYIAIGLGFSVAGVRA